MEGIIRMTVNPEVSRLVGFHARRQPTDYRYQLCCERPYD